MAQLVRITGIEAEGRHGARAGERDAPQPFRVDLEVVVEAEIDDIETTADYRDMVQIVKTVIESESHALIETLAGRLAERVSEVPGALTCRAVVHKPAAAERLGIADVSAEVLAGGRR